MMGGIPTNAVGRVLIDGKLKVIPGLYAAGECACLLIVLASYKLTLVQIVFQICGLLVQIVD
jgi:succinate dehydrogenase/fumarate reductase flavoprotein subunit